MSVPTSAPVIGATGFVARQLAGTGLSVAGLLRRPPAGAALALGGVHPVLGDLLDDLDGVLVAAREVDAVIYAAQLPFEAEPAVIGRLVEGLSGHGKTLAFLSVTGVLMQRTQGAWSPDSFAEDYPFTPELLALPRLDAEKIVQCPGAGSPTRSCATLASPCAA